MDFNSIIFPSPKSSYKANDFKGQLIWIPRKLEFTEKEKNKYSFSKVSCLMKRNSMYSLKSSPLKFKGAILCASKGKIGNYHCETMKDLKLKAKNKLRKIKYNKSEIFIVKNNKDNHKEFNIHESSGQEDFPYSDPGDSDLDEETKIYFENKAESKIINKETLEKNKIDYIPCLFIKFPSSQSKKLILYFHANYEDLGQTKPIIKRISENLKVNVLSVEFPNYGLYKTAEETKAEDIIKDSEILINFLTNVMKISLDNIIVMGRCIGSGPALHLAANYQINALILISPIKSIKEAVKSIFDKYASGWLFKSFVKER
jgi:hypothetical protein